MNKTIGILGILMLVFAAGASAMTTVDISFHQTDGTANLLTYANVEGNYWDYPSAPLPNTPTAFVQTDLSNVGSFEFHQQITQFGNGQQYPNGEAVGEWSMFEKQTLSGSGLTTYNKLFEVWTVHDGWNTAYEGHGLWTVPEGDNGYTFDGNTQKVIPTTFNDHIVTDSNFIASSHLWVNPFSI